MKPFRSTILLVMLGIAGAAVSSSFAREQQPGPGAKPQPARIDINSASEHELMRLPDITFPQVRKIIANRPYRETHELVSKGIISEATYNQIRERITVKEPAEPRRLASPVFLTVAYSR